MRPWAWPMGLLVLSLLGSNSHAERGNGGPNALAPFAIEAELAADLPWLRGICAPLWDDPSPDCMAELDRVYLDRDVTRNAFLGSPAERSQYSHWGGPQPLQDRMVWRDVFADPLALRSAVGRASRDPQCQARRGEAPHHLRRVCAADAFARLSVLHGACGRTTRWGRTLRWGWPREFVDRPGIWDGYWEHARDHLDAKAMGGLATLRESELHFAWRLRRCDGIRQRHDTMTRVDAVRPTPMPLRTRRQELELLVAASRLGSVWANAQLSPRVPSDFADVNAIAEHDLMLAYVRRARAPAPVGYDCPQSSSQARHLHLPYLLAAKMLDLRDEPRLDWRELPRHFSQAAIHCATPIAERLLREDWQPVEEQPESDATWPWAVAPPVVEFRTIRRRLAADGTLRWVYENGDEAWFEDKAVPFHWHSESGEMESGEHTMLGKRQRLKLRKWVDEMGLSRWLDDDGVEHWIDADGAEHWIDYNGIKWTLPLLDLTPDEMPRVTERTTGDYIGTEDMTARGDFDGDGVEDEAYFVRTGKTYALILRRSGAQAPVFLYSDMPSIDNYGVSALPPGRYVAHCAEMFARRGRRDCPEHVLRELVTTHDAILWIYFESAATVQYWDDGLHVLYYSE